MNLIEDFSIFREEAGIIFIKLNRGGLFGGGGGISHGEIEKRWGFGVGGSGSLAHQPLDSVCPLMGIEAGFRDAFMFGELLQLLGNLSGMEGKIHEMLNCAVTLLNPLKGKDKGFLGLLLIILGRIRGSLLIQVVLCRKRLKDRAGRGGEVTADGGGAGEEHGGGRLMRSKSGGGSGWGGRLMSGGFGQGERIGFSHPAFSHAILSLTRRVNDGYPCYSCYSNLWTVSSLPL